MLARAVSGERSSVEGHNALLSDLLLVLSTPTLTCRTDLRFAIISYTFEARVLRVEATLSLFIQIREILYV